MVESRDPRNSYIVTYRMVAPTYFLCSFRFPSCFLYLLLCPVHLPRQGISLAKCWSYVYHGAVAAFAHLACIDIRLYAPYVENDYCVGQ
jgi:hypothetical protein